MNLCQVRSRFTDGKMQIRASAGNFTGMPPDATEFIEELCNRFVLAQEATGLSKSEFAARIGMTPQQFTNVSRYRNPPSHEAIRRAAREFGFTADWFYFGDRIRFRDPDLAERLRLLEGRPTSV